MKRGWQLCMAVVLAAGCGDSKSPATVDAAPDVGAADPVARGQYIMNVLGACTFCHTPLLPNGMRDLDNLLGGVDCFFDADSPTGIDNGNGNGCLSTRNLTNDATGLKNATDTQIKDAFREGIRTDGKKIAPVMPYWVFHNMTDEDADAVVAYMRTVPGKNHTVKPNEPPWSVYNDGVTQDPVLQPEQIPMPRGGVNNQSAMRGRYLAGMTGLCIDCHTPTVNPIDPTVLQLDMTMGYGGGKLFPTAALGLIDPGMMAYPVFVATRNLTPDATGLMGWSRDQIKNAIAIGKDRDGNAVCAGTHGGQISPYAALEDQDLDDIVEYIFNLPAVENDTAALLCGIPPVGPPETGAQCTNAVDNDTDGVPNDGCLCGDCAGPPVP